MMSYTILAIAAPTAAPSAAAALQRGDLIVLPTDTVYGVGCRLDDATIERIFQAKQRPVDRAVPVLLAGSEQVLQVASIFPDAARHLAAAFWPGPLTLVLPKRDDLPANLSSWPTVGVRVPAHTTTRAIIAAAGGALAVTSANRSDQPPAHTIQAAITYLGSHVAVYLDDGPSPGGIPSTVAQCEGTTVRVLRVGPITEQDLQAALR